MSSIDMALRAFDAHAFALKHGGYKESASRLTCEYLLPCFSCGSDRLRWNHPAKQTWICWGCRRSGSSIDLIMQLEKLSLEAAYAFVKKNYVGGDASLELTPIQPKQAHVSIADLPAMPWPSGVDLLADVGAHREAWRYLAKRGVDAQTAYAYRLGYGRFGRMDRYLVFPCFQDGRLVYYQGRATWDPPPQLDSAQRKAWIRDTHFLKTRNPPTQAGMATAASVIFNYDRARYEPHVVICEGPFDAIKVGFHAIAMLGKAPTAGKITLLRQMRPSRYTIYLDRGVEEMQNALRLARELQGYGAVHIAVPPEGFDPGALTAEQNAHVIAQAPRYEPGRVAL